MIQGKKNKSQYSVFWFPFKSSPILILSDDVIVRLFFFTFFKLFKYSFLYFHPHHSPTTLIPISHPQSYPPLALSIGALYMFLDDPSLFSLIIPSHLPSGYCQFVFNFNVSGYILLACLFC